MEKHWFRKTGIIFVPISIIGVVLYVLTLAFCVNVFMAVDQSSHSVSDTLYGIFPFFVGAFTILFWIASNNCKEKK